MRRPLVIAHRGASAEEPENSLAAFRRAVELEADGVELDVHATKDGAILVHHDADIQGHLIRDMDAATARSHKLPNGEPLPTLAEALSVITPHAIAFVEIKGLDTNWDGALLQVLDDAADRDRCQIHSFDHRVIRRLTHRRPALAAGILSSSYTLDPAADVRGAGAQALWQHRELIDPPLVALVHEARYRLYAWTVDRASEMSHLADLKVDGICTNHPAMAREVLG